MKYGRGQKHLVSPWFFQYVISGSPLRLSLCTVAYMGKVVQRYCFYGKYANFLEK